MEELDRIKEEIKSNIKSSSNLEVPDEVVDEIVKRTFERVSKKDSFLDVSALSYTVRKRIEKENNVEEKTYQNVDKIFKKQINKYKKNLVDLGIIRDNLNLDDDFETIYNEAKENLSSTEKNLKEFLSIRDEIIEILNNNEISEEEKQNNIIKLQEEAKYHEIEDEKELEKMELLYTTNESLIELLSIKDISDDEKNSRYEEYNNTVRKLINENYNEKLQELISVSRDIDYILSDKANEQIMIQASELYKEIGWTKNENNITEKQKLEMSCFTDEYFNSQEEYIEKMIDFEMEENSDIKEFKEEIEELEKEILDVENDSKLLDKEKSSKLEELNDNKSEKEEELENKIKELKDDYENRYEKIVNLFKKMKKFSDSRTKFYDKERNDKNKSLTNQVINDSKKNFKEISSNIKIEKERDRNKKVDSKDNKDNKDNKVNKENDTSKKTNTQSNNNGVVYVTAPNPNNESSVPAVISNACNARNMVNEFLNMNIEEQKKFIDERGFSAIKKAISILSDNNEGYSLSRKERLSLINAIDNSAILNFNKRDIKIKKLDIITVLNEVDPLNRNNIGLFEALYGYNRNGALPNIVNGKMNEAELFRIGRILSNYADMIENGELSEEQISMMDNYLISPLNICITKNKIANMGILGKFKAIVSKKNERLNNINSKIGNINFAKAKVKDNIGNSLKNGVNNEPTINRSPISKDTINKSKIEQNRTI